MIRADNRILIFDTTLRDGEQTPGVSLNLGEKLAIARQLEALGVDVIEAGFPAASPGDFEAVYAVAQHVGCTVAGFCRCTEGDILRGWEALKGAVKPRLHLCIATSEIHMRYKYDTTPDEVFKKAIASIKLARSLCGDVEFSCEDFSRSDPKFLYPLLQAAIEAGATTLNLPDTVGYAMPDEYGAMIKGVMDNVPGIDRAIVSVHCHNDLGMATANSLMALQNGARQVETTINGIGERAGNCAMEELIMALTVRGGQTGFTHGIDTTKIYRTSAQVAGATGVPLPVCKAVVGENAFSHASGIHQHGILKNPLTYEIMTPQLVGKNKRTMVIGKLSGRHAFDDHLKGMGYTLSATELGDAFAEFKHLSDRKKQVTDEDIEAIVSHTLSGVPDFYALDTFQIQSSNKLRATAAVALLYEGTLINEAATGDGPIDAAYNAIARVVGGEWPLASYDIKAVGEGMDALGDVTVRVRHGEGLHLGRGLSTDIIEASILAYISAINRAIATEARRAVV